MAVIAINGWNRLAIAFRPEVGKVPTASESGVAGWAMSGNVCRCGTYPRIRAGIKRAAGKLAMQASGAPISTET